jgi:hypothetical protein
MGMINKFPNQYQAAHPYQQQHELSGREHRHTLESVEIL